MLRVYSLLGCLFPIPRILYAMSSDGLLFGFLSNINEKTKTPVVATAVCGFGAGKYVNSDGFPYIRYCIVLIQLFSRFAIDHIQSRTTRRHGVHWHPHIVHDRQHLHPDTQVRAVPCLWPKIFLRNVSVTKRNTPITTRNLLFTVLVSDPAVILFMNVNLGKRYKR